MNRKRFFAVIVSMIMILTLFPAVISAEETMDKPILSIEVNCSVPSEGHRLDSISITVKDSKELEGLTEEDFTLKGQSYGWSSSKEDGFKTADTHDFTASISGVEVEGNKITLQISDFTEKYFYVDSYTVTCLKNPNLTFTKEDVTKETTAVADQFKQRTAKFEDGSPDLVYNLFTPKTTAKMPLVVALHGSGDQMNTLANRVVVSWAEPEAQKEHPAYVLAPVFLDQDPEVLKETVKQIVVVINQMIESGKVDPNRVYVTGKSMGGGNTVRIAAENPDLFAAALPLCPSAARFEDVDITALKDMPIWFVQATNDKAVPIEGTRQTVQKIQDTGSYKIKFKEYTPEQMTARGILPDKHHDIEIISLEDGRYANWLFAQSKQADDALIDYVRINADVPARGHAIDTIDIYVNDIQKIQDVKASDFVFSGKSFQWDSNAENAYTTTQTHNFTAKVSDVTVDGNKMTLTITDFPEKLFYVDSFSVRNKTVPELSFDQTSVKDTVTAVSDEFLQYQSNRAAAFNYNLFTPVSGGKKMPLVLALHGSGDQMNLYANKVAVAWADPKNQQERPCYVLAPVYKDQSLEALNDVSDQAVSLIQDLVEKGLVDPNRIYVTGKSMGGMNTNRIYMNYPEIFAAAMPLCGGFPDDVKDMAENIRNKPIYILQGDGDPAGDGKLLPGSRELYQTMKDFGNSEARYHEFTKKEMNEAKIGYHDIEILAMEDTSFMEWLFNQKLK